MSENQPNLSPNPRLTFRPHRLARNPHLQTIVSSMYHDQNPSFRQTDREMILDAGQGIRLQGFYSPRPEGESKGLVLLLHGWLGNAQAPYILTIAEYLYRRDYAVFRLNMRDHGNTHHLNPGMFRADRLAELFTATQAIAQLEAHSPLHIVGASLGGNVALRLAWRHSQTPLPTLAQTIAICPAVNPYGTTLALDTGFPLYLVYFRRKWRRALRRKQAAFPDRYDFSLELAASTCMAMTRAFVRRYSPYPDAMAYFDSYAVTPAMMAELSSPVTMLAAADDPIIPVQDLEAFPGCSPYLQLYIQPYGGHVGFIDLFPLRPWSGPAILTLLQREPTSV